MAGLFELTAEEALLPSTLLPCEHATCPVWDDTFGYIWWQDRRRNSLYLARACAEDGEAFDRAAVIPLRLPSADAEQTKGGDTEYLIPAYFAHSTLDYNSREEEDAGPVYYMTLSGQRLPAHVGQASAARSGADAVPTAVVHREDHHPSRHVLILGGRASNCKPGQDAGSLYAMVMPLGIPWVSDTLTVPSTTPLKNEMRPENQLSTEGAHRLRAVRLTRMGELRGQTRSPSHTVRSRWRYSCGGTSLVTKDLFTMLAQRSSTPGALAWAPDGKRVYLVEKDAPTVIVKVPVVLDAQSGQGSAGGEGTTSTAANTTRVDLSKKRIWWAVPREGKAIVHITALTVDAAGHVWTALGAAGRVVRLSPGRLATDGVGKPATQAPTVGVSATGIVKLPRTGYTVTGCCLGGPSLGILYITAVPALRVQGTGRKPLHTWGTQLFTAKVASFTRGLPTARIEPGDISVLPAEAAGVLSRYMRSSTSEAASKL